MPEETENTIEPASPAEQRAAIDAAILERLGANWQQEWILVHNANDLVRLNKDEINLDFQADLLANVEIVERAASPLQLSGRLLAFLILGLSLFVAFLIASIAGVFN
jgi:hypothetical protein